MSERPSEQPFRKNSYNEGGNGLVAYMSSVPSIVIVLLAFMVAIYFVGSFGGIGIRSRIQFAMGLSPSRVLAVVQSNGSIFKAISSFVSYSFVHANFLHLVMNSIAFVVFGKLVALRLGGGGSLRHPHAWLGINLFLTFYIMGVCVAGLTYVMFEHASYAPMVGASGGVAALMGASVRFIFRRYQPYGYLFGRVAPLFSKGVIMISVFLIGMEIVTAIGGAEWFRVAVLNKIGLHRLGFVMSLLAWQAHIGGFVFGLLVYPFFDKLANVEARIPVNTRTL